MMRDKPFTIDKVQAGSVSRCEPEFLTIQDATRFSGVGRTSLYSLIGEGKVRTINLRKPGAARGRRLIHLASLREYLLSFQEGASV
jgi:hypothetical protein